MDIPITWRIVGLVESEEYELKLANKLMSMNMKRQAMEEIIYEERDTKHRDPKGRKGINVLGRASD